MPVNVSSFNNDSDLQHIFSINSKLPLDLQCFFSGPSSLMVSGYFITEMILLLPVCIFILLHGFHQWKQKHSSSSSAASLSHTDCLTYHMVVLEVIGGFGFFIGCVGIYSNTYLVFLLGFYFFSLTTFGEVCFHVLTCVERYLAVVHPVTYLSLKHEKGIRMRNLIISLVWLICFAGVGIMMEKFYVIVNFCGLLLALTVISFCSLSVLRVLIRPGPGDQGGGIKRVSQSKLRAFYTIMLIFGVLVPRFVWCLAWAVLFLSKETMNCMLMTSDLWFNVPCSLTLPLLYLHRAGKLTCFKKDNH